MSAPVPTSSSDDWTALIRELKSVDSTRCSEALITLKQRLTSSATLDETTVQPQLINIIFHLLHQRPKSTQVVETSHPSIPLAALNSLELLFTHPSLLTPARFQALQRKTAQLYQQSPEIKALFDLNSELTSVIRAAIPVTPVIAASTSSNSADTAATTDAAGDLRRQKRQAKEARKQAEAAERRLKQKAGVEEAKQKPTTNSTTAAPSMEALTIASSSNDIANTTSTATSSDHGVDDGSESAPFGNFHTYYQFNPPQERLQYIPTQMAEYIVQMKSSTEAPTPVFSFLDVGCNEGDLTIGLLKHLLSGLRGESNQPPIITAATESGTDSTSTTDATSLKQFVPATPSSHPRSDTRVNAIGVDIDPLLIERAQDKISSSLTEIENQIRSSTDTTTPQPTLQFAAIDVMQEDSVKRIMGLVKTAYGFHPTTATSASSSSASASILPSRPFDLVCCYSITMWIHLHHGDLGLQHFLRTLASLTTNLLIEPQPWQCYKNARERWRRKGKADPAEMKNLKWRVNVEDEIIHFVTQECQMKLRQDLGSTKWQRKVLWFQRPE